MPDEPPDRGDDADGSLVEEFFWKPHASPWSVRAFVAAYPVLVLALYRRDRQLFAGTLLAGVASLPVVSPPETDEAWATRVVLGERVWLERGLGSSPRDLGLMAIGAVAHLYTVRAALERHPVRTAVGTVASMALMALFFDRMVRLYEEHADTGATSGFREG